MSEGMLQKKFANFYKNYAILFAWLVLCVIFTFTTKNFSRASNIATVLRQASIVAIVACGQYFVMIGGAFDISVGATVGLSGVIFAILAVTFHVPIAAAMAATLVLGLVIGLLNGMMVTAVKIPAFIATLATMSICRGLAYVFTNAVPIAPIPKSIAWLGRGVIGDISTLGLPIPVLIMFVVFIIAYFVSEKTKFGRFVYATGGNPEAAYLSGINSNRITLLTFVVTGVMAAFAGIILASRMDSGHPSAGIGYEFDSITACVIGGVAITGGKGKVLGVLAGTLFLTTFFSGMTLLNVSSFYQDVLKGVVLALAVGVDAFRNRVKD
jgi:ribose transport system permease protein